MTILSELVRGHIRGGTMTKRKRTKREILTNKHHTQRFKILAIRSRQEKKRGGGDRVKRHEHPLFVKTTKK